MKKRVVAIIPARGGSKGIPRKNIIKVLDKPLVAYTIEAALSSNFIQECYISTDDDEIASICEGYGAEIIKRPDSLAGDTVSTFDTVAHAVQSLGYPDIIVVLQPTSPLRSAKDIDDAFMLLNENVDTVVGCCDFHGFLWEECDTFAIPKFSKRQRRQEMKPLFVENGSLYITRSDVYKKQDSILGMGIASKGNTVIYKMDRIHAVEIDSKDDFDVIENYLRRINANNKNSR